MVDFIDKNKLSSVFVDKVCSSCGVCKKIIKPSFCMALFGSDRDRFFKFLEYFGCLQLDGDQKFRRETIASLRSLWGFCGLFCNSYIECPLRTVRCNDVSKPLKCLRLFLLQSGISIDQESLLPIYSRYSGIEMDSVGLKFKLPSAKQLKKLFSKKDRKKVKKNLNKVKDNLRQSAEQYPFLATSSTNKSSYTKQGRKKWAKKPKPVTTMFCNDDEEWKKKIDFYLEKKPIDETDNRQPTDTAQHTG